MSSIKEDILQNFTVTEKEEEALKTFFNHNKNLTKEQIKTLYQFVWKQEVKNETSEVKKNSRVMKLLDILMNELYMTNQDYRKFHIEQTKASAQANQATKQLRALNNNKYKNPLNIELLESIKNQSEKVKLRAEEEKMLRGLALFTNATKNLTWKNYFTSPLPRKTERVQKPMYESMSGLMFGQNAYDAMHMFLKPQAPILKKAFESSEQASSGNNLRSTTQTTIGTTASNAGQLTSSNENSDEENNSSRNNNSEDEEWIFGPPNFINEKKKKKVQKGGKRKTRGKNCRKPKRQTKRHNST